MIIMGLTKISITTYSGIMERQVLVTMCSMFLQEPVMCTIIMIIGGLPEQPILGIGQVGELLTLQLGLLSEPVLMGEVIPLTLIRNS